MTNPKTAPTESKASGVNVEEQMVFINDLISSVGKLPLLVSIRALISIQPEVLKLVGAVEAEVREPQIDGCGPGKHIRRAFAAYQAKAGGKT